MHAKQKPALATTMEFILKIQRGAEAQLLCITTPRLKSRGN
jgi:hypothetical protein